MFEAGTTFAGYRIERKLGSGGMGTVLLARHPRLPRMDALKVLADSHRGDEEFRARFLREAEVAARLQHTNLVAVRDRGEYDGHLWIAMQFVDGVDLAALIKGGADVLPPPRMLHVLTEAARGLDEIHRAGLLHRDVKPANILVAPSADGPDRVLVTDFGIARPADDSATIGADGGITATLGYAAPEQLRAEPLDHRVDVYALGCTLFEMLTGSVPFARGNAGAVIYAHLHEPPPRPTDRNALIPAGFDAVIAKAMAKDPSQRYQSCRALADAAWAAAGLPGPAHDADPETGPDHRIGTGGRLLTGPSTGTARPVTIAADPSGAPPPSRYHLLGATVLAVVLVVAGTLTLILNSEETAAAPNLPRTTAPPVASPQWGAYTYVAEAFPDLLPFSPDLIGFGELTLCRPKFETRNAPFDKSPKVSNIACSGDNDPMLAFDVYCNLDRSAMTPEPALDVVEGEEKWTRPTGTGFARWGTYTTVRNVTAGYIEVFFDNPARAFCYLRATSQTSGAELHDRWWIDVPA
ncbi:serine/threonine-protein kinase [Nocardia sp. NPDC005978]|uniref:serine/threonine-protein kinase n=1 Tax=Nocardia sp. NPDC005978 TaxID=3156725 RepID=UPI0033B4A9C2